jgi:hypothetical protein
MLVFGQFLLERQVNFLFGCLEVGRNQKGTLAEFLLYCFGMEAVPTLPEMRQHLQRQ